MNDTYLDVRAKLRDGETVLVEMQVLNVPGFEMQVLYNAAKEYVVQLEKGMDYDLLKPVIRLTITDFTMSPEPELEGQVVSRFILREKEKLVDYPDGDVELVFVELPKYDLDAGEPSTLLGKWLHFLKSAPDLEVVPGYLQSIPEIGMAFEIAQFMNLTVEEERAMEKKAQWVADQKSLIKALEEQGKALEVQGKALEEQNRALEEKDRQLAELERKLRDAGIEPDA
jgi:predicted transposase/invertase (TIGR01784 family)